MTPFDQASYEERVVRPLRGLAQLPDDLLSRYAIDLGMDDAQVRERVRQVRAYWAKKARFTTTVGMVCKAFIRAHDDLEAVPGGQLTTIRWWREWARQRAATRRPEIDQLAATLRTALGDIGMIAARQLGAEAAAYPNLGGSEIDEAVRSAGLTSQRTRDGPSAPIRCGAPAGTSNSSGMEKTTSGVPWTQPLGQATGVGRSFSSPRAVPPSTQADRVSISSRLSRRSLVKWP